MKLINNRILDNNVDVYICTMFLLFNSFIDTIINIFMENI